MKKLVNKNTVLAGIVFIILGIFCFCLKAIIAVNTLYFLIPLGWILIFVGSVILLIAAFLGFRKQDMRENKALRQKKKK